MKSSLTVGQIKEAIKNLPDDFPVYATNPFDSKRVDECYYLTNIKVLKKSPINNECLEIFLGDEFGY